MSFFITVRGTYFSVIMMGEYETSLTGIILMYTFKIQRTIMNENVTIRNELLKRKKTEVRFSAEYESQKTTGKARRRKSLDASERDLGRLSIRRNECRRWNSWYWRPARIGWDLEVVEGKTCCHFLHNHDLDFILSRNLGAAGIVKLPTNSYFNREDLKRHFRSFRGAKVIRRKSKVYHGLLERIYERRFGRDMTAGI